MTRQAFELSAPSTRTSSAVAWASLALDVNTDLDAGGVAGRITALSLVTAPQMSSLSLVPITGGTTVGFVSDLIDSPTAIMLSADNGSVALSGPGLWTPTDRTAPYSGALPATDSTALSTWLDGFTDGDTITLTLSDETPPEQPTHLRVTHRSHDSLLVEWDAPAETGNAPITGYEINVDGGAWASVAMVGMRTYRFAELDHDTLYTIRVRAVNRAGAGASSAPLAVMTVELLPPEAPLRLAAEDAGANRVQVSWQAPPETEGAPITGYEVCVESDVAPPEPFRPTGTAPQAIIHGLAAGHPYGFRVRAVNVAGTGAPSHLVWATPQEPAAVNAADNQEEIPLIDVDRQSLIVRLAGSECRLEIWWQPSDRHWYTSLEVPVGTPVASGRRLAVNAGLLDRIPGVLPGNIVLRPVGEASESSEPARDAWERETHGLFWEPRI